METLKSVARSYIVRRIGLALLVMWAAFTIVFIILYLVPGDPARLIAGGDGGMTATPDQLAEINRQYGFDQPIFVQYLRALGGVLTGNLGTSYQMKQPVTTILAAEFGSTFALAMFALAVAVIIGFIVGSATVFTRSRMLSKMLDAIPPLGASLPTFWVGLMLMQFFSFGLHWFPSSGDKGFNSLVLPGVTMAIAGAALIAQVLARSLRTSYAESFVEIAKAKGAGRVRVFSAHALRNALLPTLTVLGIMVANLFAYSTVSEMIFSRNGLGLSLDKAVQTKDIPMVEGAVLIIAGVYVVTNLIIDLIYPLVDPRLKSLKRRSSRVLSSVREETVAV
ncbi:MAG: ABC-type dipeptide/oligopeptide/nickel transport system, permease component [Subtercola sp.]|jgi:peptide/nickel transport system permease protein|nr:ABC-type dipeptide/oligopeptide/nickel transport system, permease component [Subtercola sp.]